MGRFCSLWLPTPHFLTTPWDFIDSTTGLGGTKGINVENATLSMALPERQRKLFIKNFKSSKPSQEFPQEKNLKDTHIIYKSKVSSSRSRCDGRGRHLHLKALVLHHLRLISPCQSAVGKFPPHSPRSSEGNHHWFKHTHAVTHAHRYAHIPPMIAFTFQHMEFLGTAVSSMPVLQRRPTGTEEVTCEGSSQILQIKRDKS